jgi:ribonuclease D
MALQYKFFIIPVLDIEAAEDEVNRFLRSVRVIKAHREFVQQGENAFWQLSVEYFTPDEGKAGKGREGRNDRIDYKQVLPPDDFALYAKIREWRKKTAADDGAPLFTILTNEQIANIARTRPDTLEAFKGIEGIGDARSAKYADAVLRIIAEHGKKTPEEKSDEAEKPSVFDDPDA